MHNEINEIKELLTAKQFVNEYRNENDRKRYELIYGLVYMAPKPNLTHYNLMTFLYDKIKEYLKGKPCKLFLDSFDVFLEPFVIINNKDKGKKSRLKDSASVVNPDLFIVCDKNKIKQNGCHGSPDLTIEIVSKSSKIIDYKHKLDLYNKNKIKEYWIVDPLTKRITMYHSLDKDNIYSINSCGFDESVESLYFKGLKVNFAEFGFENYI
jgi:Uma2 family endonuclease